MDAASIWLVRQIRRDALKLPRIILVVKIKMTRDGVVRDHFHDPRACRAALQRNCLGGAQISKGVAVIAGLFV